MKERISGVPNITWSSPVPIRERDGYLIAVVLRVVSAGKPLDSSSMMVPVSVMDKEKVPIVGAVYAYMMHKLRAIKDKGTKIDVWEAVGTFDRAEGEMWIMNNRDKVERAEEYLMGHVGFRCYNG